MFTKLLIANRGEIACRVIRTARRMGIATVAVWSDADRDALHVAMADEAVRIGPAPVAQSYLNGAVILGAAFDTGAEAIHPGYGFLSENADFADMVEESGLAFVGPTAAAIRAMGLKDSAKRLMAAAGVPVVPGYHGADQDDAHLAAEAARIGWPVLIKARAGGGGKGMRRVEDAIEFLPALAACRREATAAFGDPAVLIEKCIQRPRHVEIQIFGDSHGAVIHLHERDCSLQRRYQKVIEEAPAPGMTPSLRAAMGGAAVRAAEAIGYRGAGTVEFILDASGGLSEDRFWFMEMNTRLQVEHPVTEAITGIDLVEWQLRIAAGEPLPMRQAEVPLTGHAVEARVYAEDPERDFLPATGRLAHLAFPDDLRVETGVRAGDEITPHYDPMIAKLIAHGPTRDIAFARLASGIARTELAGSTTNLGFLHALVTHGEVQRGAVDTGLIAREHAALLPPAQACGRAVALAALGAAGLAGSNPGLTGFTLWQPLRRSINLVSGRETLTAVIEVSGPARFRVSLGDTVYEIVALDAAGRWEVDGTRLVARVVRHEAGVSVFGPEGAVHVRLPDPLAPPTTAGPAADRVVAPMPGLVRHVTALPGAVVVRGEALMILEAMKMEQSLAAPRDGRIAEVLVQPGDQVPDGAVLVTLEPLA